VDHFCVLWHPPLGSSAGLVSHSPCRRRRTKSRAHLRSRYSYVLAVNPNLTPKWQASLRGHLDDGCGVLLPDDNGAISCRTGSPHGVDPATNESPAGRVIDQTSSSPTVAPDGSVLYGSYSRYNFARGHLWKFSSSGQFIATFDFGWDSTPAIFQHDGTYSIVIKDSHYDANCCPGTGAPAPRPFFITQLSSALRIEWQFRSTTIVQPDNPNGFESCINAPAIDVNGVVYANSEDGFVYAISQGGTQMQRIFLRQAIGAAYTPLAIGRGGLLYTENDGHLFAIGQ
jgi:outer membrane protein assembly factor BamB